MASPSLEERLRLADSELALNVADVRFWVISYRIGRPRRAGFPPVSDQAADIPGGPFGAKPGSRHIRSRHRCGRGSRSGAFHSLKRRAIPGSRIILFTRFPAGNLTGTIPSIGPSVVL